MSCFLQVVILNLRTMKETQLEVLPKTMVIKKPQRKPEKQRNLLEKLARTMSLMPLPCMTLFMKDKRWLKICFRSIMIQMKKEL